MKENERTVLNYSTIILGLSSGGVISGAALISFRPSVPIAMMILSEISF